MEDRISTLPDSVLSHILTFMPTKHGIITSVLSKRWTHLWRSVPALDFDFYDRSEPTQIELQNYEQFRFIRFLHSQHALSRFNEFVYHVLHSRDAEQAIQRFCLEYQLGFEFYDFSHFYSWIDIVLQRRVEHLQIDVFSNHDIMPELPLGILSCRTLVYLNLHSFSVKEGFSSFELPSLKTLRLRVIEFPEVRYFMLVLAACPILEDLQANTVTFSSESSVTYDEFKSFLSLSKLTRADILCSDFHFPLELLHRVEHLCIEIDKVYRGFGDIPTFHNLTHLDLFVLKYNWHFLVKVLNHCPKLQCLFLYEGNMDCRRSYHGTGGDQENWTDPKSVPECVSLHLRTCNFSDFSGLQGELQFAIYIMKNARVLQAMIINGDWDLRGEKLEMIKRKLSSCPRNSPTCHVSVYTQTYVQGLGFRIIKEPMINEESADATAEEHNNVGTFATS